MPEEEELAILREIRAEVLALRAEMDQVAADVSELLELMGTERAATWLAKAIDEAITEQERPAGS